MCYAERVIRVGFVDLKAERSLGVPGVHADNGHAASAQAEREPVGELLGLQTRPHRAWRMLAHNSSDVSGSEQHFPRQMMAPASSRTQTEVVSSETSRPT
jgi:hypothetical protein